MLPCTANGTTWPVAKDGTSFLPLKGFPSFVRLNPVIYRAPRVSRYSPERMKMQGYLSYRQPVHPHVFPQGSARIRDIDIPLPLPDHHCGANDIAFRNGMALQKQACHTSRWGMGFSDIMRYDLKPLRHPVAPNSCNLFDNLPVSFKPLTCELC